MKYIVTPAVLRVVLTVAVLFAAGCATNAATGKKNLMLVSDDEETQLSLKEHENLVRTKGLYSDKKIQDYVQQVGKKIVQVSDRRNIQYQFFVLNQREVNAFALPNGYVYVTRGLLSCLNSEAELAAVLAHEVAHVAARHSSQLLSDAKVARTASIIVGVVVGVAVGSATGDANLAQSTMDLTSNVGVLTSGLILGSYSREHELEADQLGTNYLSRSGYPPEAIVTVLDTLKSIEKFEAARAAKNGKKPQIYHQAFATHPALNERIEKVALPASTGAMQDPAVPQAEYLEKTAGLVFETFDEIRSTKSGPDSWFNRESLFQGYLPSDWKVVKNTKEEVALENATDHVRTGFRLLPPQPDHDPDRFFSGPQVGATAVRNITSLPHVYHKRPAFSAFAELKTGETVQQGYLGVLFHEQYTILVTGFSNDPAWLNSHRYVFDAQTNLTRILTQDEYNERRVKRLKVVKAQEGDTYSSLAKTCPLGVAGEGYLRLINRQYPTGEPVAGQSVKTVVAD